jgi:hypothetical protein
LVTKDANTLEMDINGKEIVEMSKSEYKNVMKINVKAAAFNCMQDLQEGHSKVTNTG